MAQAATKTATDNGIPREAPVIPAAALQWQGQGFCYREAFIRLPADLTLADLNEAAGTIWAKVQRHSNIALRQFDRIRAVSFDEDWLVDATVASADANQVTLAGIKKTDLPGRGGAGREDSVYRTIWAGTGYAVERKADNVTMGQRTFRTVDAAWHYRMTLDAARVVT